MRSLPTQLQTVKIILMMSYATAVKLLNNLSADLDIMRPSMLETGLEIACL